MPTRSFEPRTPEQAAYWTTSYPVTALLPMAALVDAVVSRDFSQVAIPALFRLSDDDRVVRADISREVAAGWGANGATVQAVTMGPEDDAYSHVIAGDIMSPGQTEQAVVDILSWLAAQGIQ